MPIGKPLNLRLFLEGVEVPVISAQVQVSFFAPVSAAIQIVPLDEALDLKPRTMVHLFFLEEPKVENGVRADLSKGFHNELADKSYKLLFAGELVGVSFVKTPMSRGLVLQCLDFSTYWDYLQTTLITYGTEEDNSFLNHSRLYASSDNKFSNLPMNGVAERIAQWAKQKPKTPGLTSVGGLAGGIIHIMEQVAGLPGHKLGVNDYFTLAELRCKLLSQVTAEDGDSSAQNLLDVHVFMDWIMNQLQNMGPQVSLRDIFKLLCQYIYYAIVPNPVAKFDSAVDENGNPKKAKISWARKTGNVYSLASFQTIRKTAQDAHSILQAEDELTQNEAEDLRKKVEQNVVKLMGSLPSPSKKMMDAGTILLGRLQNYTTQFETLQAHDRGARKHLMKMDTLSLLEELSSEGEEKTTTGAAGSRDVAVLDRLRAQIFRPDCFMVAPPMCNIIFPEMYSSLNYDRNFLDEVTRVMISYYGALEGRDKLTANRILQPKIRDLSKHAAKAVDDQWRVLMDHELHTGIIAKEEWVPDSFSTAWLKGGKDSKAKEMLKESTISWSERTGLFHFFKYRIGPRTVSVQGRFMPYIVAGFPGLVIQKPFFPSGIEEADGKKILSRIRSSMNPHRDLGAPHQFLGMIESFTHNIGQDGATSSLSMSHCRSHLGSDDAFVGTVFARYKEKKKRPHKVTTRLVFNQVKNNPKLLNLLRQVTPQDLLNQASPRWEPSKTLDQTLTKTDFSMVETPTTYDTTVVGPNGELKTVQKTLSVRQYQENTSVEKERQFIEPVADLYAKGTTYTPSPPGAKTVGDFGLRGTIDFIRVLQPYTTIQYQGARYYSAVLLHETVELPFDEDSRPPFEYIVMPSWMSTSYDNEKIGEKVYQPFFGCDSIIDQIMFGPVPPRPAAEGTPIDPQLDDKSVFAKLEQIERQRDVISIEKAVNVIAWLYGQAKKEGIDVDEFINSMIRRPIASKHDILGSFDLQISMKGEKPKIENGHAGFHTMSVHPVVVGAGKLAGLLDNPAVQMEKMDKSGREAMKADYDVRAAKLEKVQEYMEALTTGSHGFIG